MDRVSMQDFLDTWGHAQKIVDAFKRVACVICLFTLMGSEDLL